MALTIDDKIAILDRQIRDWEVEEYNTEEAARTHTTIGSPKERIDQLVEANVKARRALVTLRERRDTLVKQGQPEQVDDGRL